MSETNAGPRVLAVPEDRSDWVVPSFGKKVVPRDGRVDVTDAEDTVTSFDTATGDLAALGVTLTRGAGSTAGWTLRVAGASAGFAAEFPGAGRGVPVEIRDLLLGVRAGAALRAGPRSAIRRTVHHVLDAEGAELGRIDDVRTVDTGTGADDATVTITPRRHLEISGWDGPFVDAVVARLLKAGAIEAGRPAAPVPPTTVGDAVVAHLGEQRAAILRADLDLRRGEDAVHAFRVAIRRVRSALRVVGVFEAEAAGSLDDDLRWLSGVLGAVRDAQVLREHLRSSVDALAGREDVDLAATDAALAAAVDREEADARAALTTALRGRRYLALLRTLREWCTEPPVTEAAAEPGATLARYVRAAAKDLDRKLAKASGSAERLHRARKAAKRARYVASFAGDAAGKHGPAVARRAKALQTALGDHQDCILAAEFVARVATAVPGDAAFGCGVLWVHEQDRAAAALARARTKTV